VNFKFISPNECPTLLGMPIHSSPVRADPSLRGPFQSRNGFRSEQTAKQSPSGIYPNLSGSLIGLSRYPIYYFPTSPAQGSRYASFSLAGRYQAAWKQYHDIERHVFRKLDHSLKNESEIKWKHHKRKDLRLPWS